MKTIYIDKEFCCHVTNPDCTLQAVETDAFDNFCDSYIECYRFVPSGEAWTGPDGTVFEGEMFTPFKDYSEFEEEQRAYERQQYEAALADAETALAILLGGETV